MNGLEIKKKQAEEQKKVRRFWRSKILKVISKIAIVYCFIFGLAPTLVLIFKMLQNALLNAFIYFGKCTYGNSEKILIQILLVCLSVGLVVYLMLKDGDLLRRRGK